MPLFGRTASDPTSSGWEPEAAAGRLAHTAGADAAGVFTSDLSVAEYVLLGEAGFEPLGFVIVVGLAAFGLFGWLFDPAYRMIGRLIGALVGASA